MKRRKKSPKKLKAEELEKIVTLYIKRRDGYTCQRCLREVEGSNCHVSHVIPKSKGNALRYDDQNLKVLCFFCHLQWWHKNPLEAGEWFKEKFPLRWEYLQRRREDIVSFLLLS